MSHGAKKGPGRPAKLKPDVVGRIVEAVGVGMFRRDAARYAGIGRSTLYRWLERGQADEAAGLETDFHDLWARVSRAEAVAEVRMVATLTKAAERDWRAAVSFLERRYPERWGRTRR
jgi:transposase